jgi:hypothetical protein
VRAAARAGAQIGDQFLQLDRAPFYFDPDVSAIAGRSYQQVQSVGRGAMLGPAPLQNDLISQPATFEDKKGSGGKLTNILAQEPGWRFRREYRKTEARSLFRISGQATPNLAFRVQGEEVLFQSQEEILCFPDSQGRIDFQTGKGRPLAGSFPDPDEFLLQERFGVSQRPRIQLGNIGTQQWFAKQIDSDAPGRYSLPEHMGWRLLGRTIPIMKLLLTLLTLAIVGILSADAKTFKLPDDDFAVASIDMPDSWKPKEIDGGVAGQSADDAVYLSVVAVGSEKGMNAEIDDTFEMLKSHNVTLDESTKKEEKFKIGNLEATELLYQGKDEDGPAAVSIVFVPIKDKLIIMTYWVTTAKEKEHQAEVGKIVNSLKASS